MILTVVAEDRKSYSVEASSNLLSVLRRYGYLPDAVCGGNGICGKCLVVIEGKGKHLACKTIIDEDMTVILKKQADDISALGLTDKYGTNMTNEKDTLLAEENIKDRNYAIAIDIGTTTLAFALLNISSERVLDTYTSRNHQYTYGLDVISRIKASNDGEKASLKKCIQEDLYRGIQILLEKNDIQPEALKNVILSGNTTMGHLLFGYNCQSLGVYPFTPVTIDRIEEDADKVFENADLAHAKVVFLPGISTFVGADIVSGLYQCEFLQKDKPCLLIDLGTNGEMAIGMKDKILVASTAAGPAFEGGNITYGVASIKGAICSVEIDDANHCKCRTIADGMPIGICGTGVIEAIAELRKAGLVDETGLLTEKYFENGFSLALAQDGTEIVITQKDIREIQLAKAAVRAGLETLIHRYGTSYEEIECVYIAGGFGYFMDIQKATLIGMLPNELWEKTIAAGNTSLNGAIKYILQENAKEKCHEIVNISEEISLATDKEFQEFYMEYMLF